MDEPKANPWVLLGMQLAASRECFLEGSPGAVLFVLLVQGRYKHFYGTSAVWADEPDDKWDEAGIYGRPLSSLNISLWNLISH